MGAAVIGFVGMVLLAGLILIGGLWHSRRAANDHRAVLLSGAWKGPAASHVLHPEAQRAMAAARLGAISPDAPVSVWLEFAVWDRPMRERALAGARALPDRQAQVESMIARGHAAALPLLGELDLVATSTLREGVRRYLSTAIAAVPISSAVPQPFAAAIEQVERCWPALEWLSEHEDVSGMLDVIDERARSYPALADRQAFTRRLAGLRRVAMAHEAMRH